MLRVGNLVVTVVRL